MLDISGSMQSTLGVVKDSGITFVKTANERRRIPVAHSLHPASARSPAFTTDTGTIEVKIAYTRPGGFTALIDTVYLGLNQMRRARNPQRALIVVSDGMDNHSRYSKGELLKAALEADVQIYTIIIDNGAGSSSPNTVPFRPSMIAKPGDQGAARQGPSLLEELAEDRRAFLPCAQ